MMEHENRRKGLDIVSGLLFGKSCFGTHTVPEQYWAEEISKAVCAAHKIAEHWEN
jgi:hypothetical protein